MAGAQNEGLSVAERRRQLAAQREQQAAVNAQNAVLAGNVSTPEMPLDSLVHNPRNARQDLEGVEGGQAVVTRDAVDR